MTLKKAMVYAVFNWNTKQLNILKTFLGYLEFYIVAY